MDTPPQTILLGFAYGEAIDAALQRSLGYRLLTPSEPEPWSDEVEALARTLQAASYPDEWPATEAFCSVLLSDGQRLVGLARYGLTDHTPSQRRGGLELIGVVGPGGLGVPSALALYRWLQHRRANLDNLCHIGDRMRLADILTLCPAQSAQPDPNLPIRLWQEGAVLFAASEPDDPDRHLPFLEGSDLIDWQWLPLVPADFPLRDYAQRGPLIAWRPHLPSSALKVE